MADECKGAYHKESMRPAPFKYCPECGAMINPKMHVTADCWKFHAVRKSKGNRFCPDCAEKLKK